MKFSAGIIFIFEDKVLLAHATNSPWYHSYTPPKGEIEMSENPIDAAIRETKEEIGISVKKENLSNSIEVIYTDKKNKPYKKVTLFVYIISTLEEIGLTTENVPKSQLQLSEVDEARFMEEEEIKVRILPRYQEQILNLIMQ